MRYLVAAAMLMQRALQRIAPLQLLCEVQGRISAPGLARFDTLLLPASAAAAATATAAAAAPLAPAAVGGAPALAAAGPLRRRPSGCGRRRTASRGCSRALPGTRCGA